MILRLASLLILMAGPALADWRVIDPWSEPLQAFETRAATSTNAQGYQIWFYRNPVGRVYMLIALPDDAPDLIRSGPVATLTPQGHPPKQIEAQAERGRIVEYALSTGRMLRDRLWHGEGAAPAFGTFHDVLNAPVLSVTLSFVDGTQATTDWSMQDAATPVAQALGLSLDGIAAGAAWEDAAAQALLAAMTACQFPKLEVACVQKVTACSPRISEARDIDSFETCVSESD